MTRGQVPGHGYGMHLRQDRGDGGQARLRPRTVRGHDGMVDAEATEVTIAPSRMRLV